VLDALVEEAVESNLDLRIAAARVRESRAALRISGADRYPTLVAGAAGGWRQDELLAERLARTPERGEFYELGFDASWEADVFGGLRAATDASRTDLLAAQYAHADLLVTLLAELGRNYLELRGTQARLALAYKHIALQQEALELLRVRVRAGLAAELDATRAETDLASIRAVVPEFEARIRANQHRLAVLLGREPIALATRLDAAEPVPPVPPDVPIGFPSDLLERRPDVREAQARVAGAAAGVGAARADLFPRFFLSGAWLRTAEELGSFSLGPASSYGLGPVVTLPIFNAGRIRANIAVQDARLEQALLGYELTLLRSLAEVESALAAYGRERERHAELERAAGSAALAETLAVELHAQGLADYFAVIDARRLLYAREDELTASTADLAVKLVALYKTPGGGWHSLMGP
jgi:outer membrane protein, multidrug efflux system